MNLPLELLHCYISNMLHDDVANFLLRWLLRYRSGSYWTNLTNLNSNVPIIKLNFLNRVSRKVIFRLRQLDASSASILRGSARFNLLYQHQLTCEPSSTLHYRDRGETWLNECRDYVCSRPRLAEPAKLWNSVLHTMSGNARAETDGGSVLMIN